MGHGRYYENSPSGELIAFLIKRWQIFSFIRAFAGQMKSGRLEAKNTTGSFARKRARGV